MKWVQIEKGWVNLDHIVKFNVVERQLNNVTFWFIFVESVSGDYGDFNGEPFDTKEKAFLYLNKLIAENQK